MTTKQMTSAINKTAKNVRKEFDKVMPKDSTLIEIEWGIPTLAINLPDGTEYFFQGEEAKTVLRNAVETSNKFNTSVEDTLLYLSQGW